MKSQQRTGQYTKLKNKSDIRPWTLQDSNELYLIDSWGGGFFKINGKGNIAVHPKGYPAVALSENGNGAENVPSGIDLKELVEDLKRRGISAPILIRFTDILHARVRSIWNAFHQAMANEGYRGRYRGVYPIKVNQQRHIVEELLSCGRELGLGLEAGSKPELLIALALMDNPNALLICNGYKDSSYIEAALLSQKLGRQTIVVIDRYDELDLILQKSKEYDVKPVIGVRAKLAARGAGKWFESGGDASKFGLSTTEILDVIDRLKREKMLDCLQMLHFHIGSQITAIRAIKDALKEASRLFVEIVQLGAPLRYFDAGGGLGVDYDGSQSNFHSSVNYSINEYAADVVNAICEACNQRGMDHPDIITESGRALAAHHAMLVVEALGVNSRTHEGDRKLLLDAKSALGRTPVDNLREIYHNITKKNFLESFHDATQLKEEVLTSFNLGIIDIRTRAACERLFWMICDRILRYANNMKYVPDDLEPLLNGDADLYFCNFSVFQSTPDHWAVNQLFPIMPIHRLDVKPTRKGILADLTCDSDGKVDQFIDIHDVKHALPLHDPNKDPYYLGIFLIGAYQECLGDLHNLFGDTFVAHVISHNGGYRITDVVDGDTVSDALGYVQYSKRNLTARLRNTVGDALKNQSITAEESELLLSIYERAMGDYTYLTSDRPVLRPPVPAIDESAVTGTDTI